MKVGVIGTGVMGSNHLRVINKINEIELTSAVDINEDNLDNNTKNFKVIKENDYRNIVDFVDSVVISSPTETHYDIAKFFITKGKNVLIEKPITYTIEQADELIRLANDNNVVLAVGHIERFNPAVIYIKKLIKNPLFIEIQRLGRFSMRSLDIDVILDLMIHDLDIILQWDKSGVRDIRISGIPVISRKVDIANARLEFNSGLVANVTASRVSQKKTRKLRIFQKNKYFSIDYKKRIVKYYELNGINIKEEIPEIEDIEPLYSMWKNFHEYCKNKKGYIVSGKEGRDALELALNISKNIMNAKT